MSVKKSVNALDFSGNSVGCFVKGGKLTPVHSYRSAGSGFPSGVKSAVYSRALNAYLLITDSRLFFSPDLKTFTFVCQISDGSQFVSPFIIECTHNRRSETLIVAGKYYTIYTPSSSLIQEKSVCAFSCGVLHCGRFFCGDAYNGLLLRWSIADKFNFAVSNLLGNGYLILDPQRGNILNLIVYNGKLIAVREYGLTVLSIDGLPENFSVDLTDTDCDKIYKDTVQIVANKLYFCSESGLKCFDGNKISPIELRHIITEPVASAKYGDEYLVAGTSSLLKRNVILCVRPSDGVSCIIDVSATGFLIKDGLNFFRGTNMYKLCGGDKYTFESDPIDFGTSRAKTVSKIDIHGNAELRISNGVCTRIFPNASGIVRPHLRGKSFTVFVGGRTALDGITVTAEVTDGIV